MMNGSLLVFLGRILRDIFFSTEKYPAVEFSLLDIKYQLYFHIINHTQRFSGVSHGLWQVAFCRGASSCLNS